MADLNLIPIGSLLRVAWLDEILSFTGHAVFAGWESPGFDVVLSENDIRLYIKRFSPNSDGLEYPRRYPVFFETIPHGTKGLLLVKHVCLRDLNEKWYGIIWNEKLVFMRAEYLVLEKTSTL